MWGLPLQHHYSEGLWRLADKIFVLVSGFHVCSRCLLLMFLKGQVVYPPSLCILCAKSSWVCRGLSRKACGPCIQDKQKCMWVEGECSHSLYMVMHDMSWYLVVIIVPSVHPKAMKLFQSESPPVMGPSKPRGQNCWMSPPIASSTQLKHPQLVSELGNLAAKGWGLMQKVQQAVLDLGEWEDEVHKVLKEESK